MPILELLMPEMGESITDATLSKWLVKVGDAVDEDQDILEVSTDKVDTEVQSPSDGVIKEILYQEGEVVDVGKVLAIIELEGGAEVIPSPAVATQPVKTQEPEPIITEAELKHPTPPYTPSPEEKQPIQISNNGEHFYSPLVKTIAKEEEISESELSQINGSGMNGRVTKDDLLNYLSNRSETTVKEKIKPVSQSTPKTQKAADNHPTKPAKHGDEIVEMDKMRKLISDHMVMSKKTSPHATLFAEADVTNIVNWRNKVKNAFLKREGEKLTYTPLFIEATSNAIKAFPGVNVSVIDDNKIHYKKEINIGMATALPDGNLILPVVKNTAEKTLLALTRDVNDLAVRARNSKLKPDDVMNGTFSLTNIGTFDGLMGMPIINQPQAAILAVGAIKKKPVVVETEVGDVIAVRQMMYLSLSMDHRVVDGALGGAFLQRVKQELEGWDVDREI